MLFTLSKAPAFPLALGGAGLGSDDKTVFFNGPVNEQGAVATVLWAMDNGINLIDTSPFYGSSEKRIGIAVKEFGKRDSLLLSTKVGTHPVHRGYTAERFQRSIESSLKTLQTDRLDIVHIHDSSENDLRVALGKSGGMETLLRLKEQGVIRYIGLGVRDHGLHRQFIDSGYADIILPYLDHNLLRQTATPLLQKASEKNIAVMMGSPLCMGLLSGRDPRTVLNKHFDVTHEVPLQKAVSMYEWCKAKEIDIKKLNFQFMRSNKAITAIVTGATSLAECKENLQAFSHPYPSTVLGEFVSHFNLEKYTEVLS